VVWPCTYRLKAYERQMSTGVQQYVALKNAVKSKGKGFPYSIPSVGPGADPGVQAVSLQVL